MSLRYAIPALALLISAGGEALAAGQGDDGDEQVCVAIATVWRGSNAEAARISEEPIPESFRRPFLGGGCTRFSLVEASLIDWHLGFGSETTTRAALAFLAADPQLVRAPSPEDFGPALARAWRAAERDLRAVAAIQASGDDRDRSGTAMRRSRPVQRLWGLVRAHEHYLLLAQHSLRAAEFFGSAASLADARRYLAAVQAGMAILYARPGADGFPDLGIRNALSLRDQYPAEIGDIEIRVALQTARFSRDPADIDAAQALLDAAFDPVLRDAAHNANRQDDFCNNGSGDRLDDIRAVCREDIDFLRRFTRFWRAQAEADLLMAADPDHYVERPLGPPVMGSGSSFVRGAGGATPEAWGDRLPHSVEMAIHILKYAELEQIPNGTIYGRPWDAEVALHLGRADMYVRLGEAASRGAGRRANSEAADLFGGALSALLTASNIVPAAEDPGRFRQIATRFLVLLPRFEAMRRLDREEDYAGHSGHARQAAYFRLVLDSLDRIAVGLSPAR